MSKKTQLTISGTPGKGYRFTTRSKILAQFTRLSISAFPSKKHKEFIAKAPAYYGKGTIPFTRLSVIGVSGRRHKFIAKVAAGAGVNVTVDGFDLIAAVGTATVSTQEVSVAVGGWLYLGAREKKQQRAHRVITLKGLHAKSAIGKVFVSTGLQVDLLGIPASAEIGDVSVQTSSVIKAWGLSASIKGKEVRISTSTSIGLNGFRINAKVGKHYPGSGILIELRDGIQSSSDIGITEQKAVDMIAKIQQDDEEILMFLLAA